MIFRSPARILLTTVEKLSLICRKL